MALDRECEKLTDEQDKAIFSGRLGQYRYDDMDKVIRAAMDDMAALKRI